MSRHIISLSTDIQMAYGDDHALGHFISIYDHRRINEDSEGLVYDYDELFGEQVNLIEGLSKDDFTDVEVVVNKINSTYEKILNK